MRSVAALTTALLTATLPLPALAQTVEIQHAWARATVQGQMASGAFMTLTSKTDARLVSASTPVAGLTEVHAMKMEGDIMTMRALPAGLHLPAGTAVELKPGGYHLMLMDLKVPLQKDTTIPLTLVFKDAQGAERRQHLRLSVGTAAPSHP